MGVDLRSLLSRQWAPIGLSLLVGGVGAWVGADLVVSSVVNRLRPELEQQISKPLGHQLRIGPYRGLRPWGIEIGSTRILPGPSDDSSASLSGATIKFAPLASLRRWRPVVILDLHGARLSLRRNQQGAYWVPGTASSAPPPELDLELGHSQPARIDFEPAGVSLRATTRLNLQLANSVVDGKAKLTLPEGGRLTLEGRGHWDQPDFLVRTRLEQIRLRPLQALLPGPKPVALQGQLGGEMQLSLAKGRMACKGGISGVSLQMLGGPFTETLSSPEARVLCRGGRLKIPKTQWRYGSWRASLGGAVQLNESYQLDVLISDQQRDLQLLSRLRGTWHQPRLLLNGQWRPKAPLDPTVPVKFQARLQADWRDTKAVTAALAELQVQGAGLDFLAHGPLYPELGVKSRQLQLGGRAFKTVPLLAELLGTKSPVRGSLELNGPSLSPSLRLALGQRHNPLLRRWSLQAGWSEQSGLLKLGSFESKELRAAAQLPLKLNRAGVRVGELQADLSLDGFPLKRLDAILGTTMGGSLSVSGRVTGPLDRLSPDLNLELVDPEAGRLRLLEEWRGTFTGVAGGGGRLLMASVGSVMPGTLRADLAANWLPSEVTIKRRDGRLTLTGSPALYRWQADDFSLNGIELALPSTESFWGAYGRINGEGELGLQPLSMQGRLIVNNPGLSRLRLRQAILSGNYANQRYTLSGELLPPDTGQVTFKADGRVSGRLKAHSEVRGISARWLLATALNIPELLEDSAPAPGRAADLGTLFINTFGGALDGQLRALARANASLLLDEKLNRESTSIHLEDLRGQIDAVADLNGPALDRLDLDLKVRGHLWTEGQDEDQALMVKPFVATLRGPLQGGDGTFSLLHLPFSLLALVAPVPASLRGAFGMEGRYSLGHGHQDLAANLKLEDASLGTSSLLFDRGGISLVKDRLNLDLALRSSASKEPVTLTGQVPLDAVQPLDVRVESHGDGLRFLTGLAGDNVVWKGGSTDLKLLFSGSLHAPQANGFLVMKDVSFLVSDQSISGLKAAMVFDFSRLEVQSLQGKIGAKGSIRGQGAIGLLQPTPEKKPLAIQISDARIKSPLADVLLTANIDIGGALVKPRFGGELQLDKGKISPRRSMFVMPKKDQAADSGALARSGAKKASAQHSEATQVSANTLLEQKWDFSKPLVLLGPDVEAASSRAMKKAMPNFPSISFDNLRLRMGPDLQVIVQPLANFRTKGLLSLNGALDPSLQVRGVVQLLKGRLSLFTTTFHLDRRAPNVAVFTPSMGLIPYVDIAMKTEVSDSVSLGTGTNTVSSNIFDTNGTGALGAAGQLRLVKVVVTVAGPADRFAQHLKLRSYPPMPKAQLMALIGGNSLAGLSNSDAGAAIATALGQSLLSPMLGTFSDAFSERMEVALYPTYVSPVIDDRKERVSGRVPPQLALVTDFGMAITDAFDFSVLAAPNRNDIPAQGTLTYDISPNLSLSGSVDTQGTWQSQMQLFFRF